ncbi:MAG: ParA family protein [Tissierellia bacterium]|nr:ParA family protein [Tissierellia bacterium]
MARIISCFNQKGGVGKTTTAVNLAAMVAKTGKRTLLFDFDPQANATSGVGVDKKDSRLYDLLINKSNLEEALIETEYKNLFLIPADNRLAGLEVELALMEGWERILKDALAPIKDKFEYIIIDAPPSLGILSMLSLIASDSILIPIQSEYYALEGVSELYSTYNKIKKKLNPDLEIEGVLLTMYDSRTNLSKSVKTEAENFFKDKVYKTTIPRNIKVAESPSFGKPVVYYDWLSSGAIAYKKLAREFLKRGEKR